MCTFKELPLWAYKCSQQTDFFLPNIHKAERELLSGSPVQILMGLVKSPLKILFYIHSQQQDKTYLTSRVLSSLVPAHGSVTMLFSRNQNLHTYMCVSSNVCTVVAIYFMKC